MEHQQTIQCPHCGGTDLQKNGKLTNFSIPIHKKSNYLQGNNKLTNNNFKFFIIVSSNIEVV